MVSSVTSRTTRVVMSAVRVVNSARVGGRRFSLTRRAWAAASFVSPGCPGWAAARRLQLLGSGVGEVLGDEFGEPVVDTAPARS